ncbi:MAG TPA: hypothetical protein PK668_12580 [Myxococcota bacterium]|nr:hypothetical protein [Myxococcota bacterium]HRY93694.1 hypothetical protein [Myxococcota bacterium]
MATRLWTASLLMLLLGVCGPGACGTGPGEDLASRSDPLCICPLISDYEIAAHWAPRFYQDTNDSHDAINRDEFTSFNFDYNYQGRDNQNHALDPFEYHDVGEDLETVVTDHRPAYVYYSVSRAGSFSFIGYYLFHSQDYSDDLGAEQEHENDLEGVFLLVGPDPASEPGCNCLGHLYAAATVAHGTIDVRLRSDNNDDGLYWDAKDGTQTLELFTEGTNPEQPCFQVEAGGHAIYAIRSAMTTGCPRTVQEAEFYEGTFVFYDFGGHADIPAMTCHFGSEFFDPQSDFFQIPCHYELIGLNDGETWPPAGRSYSDPWSSQLGDEKQGFWFFRDSYPGTAACGTYDACPMVSTYINLRGNDHSIGADENAAQPPWAWNDNNDAAKRGDQVCDPIHFWEARVTGNVMRKMPGTYTNHAYWDYSVQINSLNTTSVQQNVYPVVRNSSRTDDIVTYDHWRIGQTIALFDYTIEWGGYDTQQIDPEESYVFDILLGPNVRNQRYFCAKENTTTTVSLKAGTQVLGSWSFAQQDIASTLQTDKCEVNLSYTRNRHHTCCSSTGCDSDPIRACAAAQLWYCYGMWNQACANEAQQHCLITCP